MLKQLDLIDLSLAFANVRLGDIFHVDETTTDTVILDLVHTTTDDALKGYRLELCAIETRVVTQLNQTIDNTRREIDEDIAKKIAVGAEPNRAALEAVSRVTIDDILCVAFDRHSQSIGLDMVSRPRQVINDAFHNFDKHIDRKIKTEADIMTRKAYEDIDNHAARARATAEVCCEEVHRHISLLERQIQGLLISTQHLHQQNIILPARQCRQFQQRIVQYERQVRQYVYQCEGQAAGATTLLETVEQASSRQGTQISQLQAVCKSMYSVLKDDGPLAFWPLVMEDEI